MGIPLAVLIVEDTEQDADFVVRALERAGRNVTFERVENANDMQTALETRAWDVIISDYSLPKFDAPGALKVLQETDLDIPFIVVSGSIGEDSAVAMMKAGAHDYLMKDNLSRLPPAVERELGQAEIRRERKRAENAVRESEARFRELAENLQEVFYVYDPIVNQMSYVSPSYENIFGRSCESLYASPLSFMDAIHPDDRPLAEAALKRQEAGEITDVEYRVIGPDGRVSWIRDHSSPVLNVNNDVRRIVGTAQDITARKKAEDGLRLFRTLIDRSNDAIEVVDPETGRFLDVNERGCLDLGYTRQEILNLTIFDIDPKIDRTSFAAIRESLDKSGSALWEGIRHRKDATTFPVEVNVKFVQLDRDYIVAIVRDITERNHLQAQFLQAQKLESVGRLAGGIAHDFNNLLGVIIGYTDFALEALSEDGPLRADITEIRSASNRAIALVKQLLAFSRTQLLRVEVVNLNRIIADAVKILRRVLGEDIDLSFLPAHDLGQVKVDPVQIEQVIMNLAVNARDAMPNGGKLTLETANVVLDEEYAAKHKSVPPGPYIMLAMSDTGAGMDPATLEKIFEPFFTTKELGKGTGLGLATVYGIVRQSAGSIWVYSVPGKGTAFKIYLPRVDDDEAPESQTQRRESPRGHETVLVVEDEDTLCQMTRRILEQAGYTVFTAANGIEALEWIERAEGPLDLVVTDVVMPKMGGHELAEKLRAVRPGLKVVYVSGYADHAVLNHGILEKGTHFIDKPFTATELRQRVRDILDSTWPAG